MRPLHLAGLHLSAPATTATPVRPSLPPLQFGSFGSSAAPMEVDQSAATAAAAVQCPGAGAAYDPNLLVVQTLVPALIAALQQGLQQQQPQAVTFEGGSHPVPPTLLGPTLPALGSVGLPPAAARWLAAPGKIWANLPCHLAGRVMAHILLHCGT